MLNSNGNNNSNGGSSRYSKLSAVSNTTVGAAEIGEETQTNQVNETKTIKEKLGRECSIKEDTEKSSGNYIPSLNTIIVGKHMKLKYRYLESERKTMPPPKLSKRLTTTDMQPIIE